MRLVDLLAKKNIKVTEFAQWGVYFRKQWEERFADHLSEEDKQAIYLHDVGGCCGYLWHLFSYKRRECAVRAEADRAFQSADKHACYVFYQRQDTVLLVENAAAFTPDDLADEFDMYVVDKEWTWTYVKTHETEWCGPYFSQN